MRVLVVEDERRVASFLKRGLTEEGHEVDVAGTASDALTLVRERPFDVIVLDIELPDGDGFTVASTLRTSGTLTPILMLTARDARDDVVRGLDVGADDYLTKPFDFAELIARLRALGRRAAGSTPSNLAGGDITVDRLRHEVVRAGVPLHLTPIEYRLLETLMVAGGEPVSRAELLRRVWAMDFDPGTPVIDVHVANLRAKLEQDGRPRVIVAVKGVGFRFAPEDT